jgi:hypothetical protein
MSRAHSGRFFARCSSSRSASPIAAVNWSIIVSCRSMYVGTASPSAWRTRCGNVSVPPLRHRVPTVRIHPRTVLTSIVRLPTSPSCIDSWV